MGSNCSGPVTSSQNVQTRWTFDSPGDTITQVSARQGGTDSAYLTTGYAYDWLNRLVKVTEDQGSSGADHLNLATAYAFNPAGDLTSQTDGLNHQTSYAVDDLGRVTKVTDANSNIVQTSYSLAGEVTQVIDGRSQTNAYTLDRLGRTSQVALTPLGRDRRLPRVRPRCRLQPDQVLERRHRRFGEPDHGRLRQRQSSQHGRGSVAAGNDQLQLLPRRGRAHGQRPDRYHNLHRGSAGPDQVDPGPA